MDEGTIAKVLIMAFLLCTGALRWGTQITFPWRMKDFRNFSMDWRLRKEDFITALLVLLGVLLFTSGADGLGAGIFWLLVAAVSHILIHLRRTSELVVTPQAETEDTSEDLREMYLSIMKRWHPDKATTGEDFFRHNHITALANKAYEAHDSASLEKLDALKKG